MVDKRGDGRGAKKTTKNPKPPRGGSGTALSQSGLESAMNVIEQIVTRWEIICPFVDRSPVDEDWLISMGGVRMMQTAGSSDFAFGTWLDQVSSQVSVGRLTPLVISLRDGKKQNSEVYVYGVLSEFVYLGVPTKSKIMMLLHGLGIRDLED